MPSRRHQLLAYAVPRVRGSRDLVDEPTERARVEQWQQDARPQPADPAGARLRAPVLGRDRGAAGRLPGPRRHAAPPRAARTLFHVHGGGVHVAGRRVQRPLRGPARARRSTRGWWSPTTRSPPGTPGATRSPRWPTSPPGGRARAGPTLVGDSAGGGYALALALGAARPGRPAAERAAAALAVGRPDDLDARRPRRSPSGDPWLFLGKVHAYARWWAGSARRPRPAGGEPGARRPRPGCRAR